jgi:beta-glucanase (GH16 family)
MPIKSGLALVVLILLLPGYASAQSSPGGELPGWVLLWQDEFAGEELDANKWNRVRRGGSDWCDTMSDDPRVVLVADGVLKLRAIPNDGPGRGEVPIITGGIDSKGKFEFEHGKVLIRARFQSAQGAWPALWMFSAKSRSGYGEIDLMEHLNFDDIIYQTIHSEYTLKIAKSNNPPKGTRVKIDREAWNTYGCEWDSEKIVFTVNGRATHTYPRMPELGAKQWTFDEPFYFILSMQVGGSWVNSAGPTRIEDYPAGMEIDWVRVYQREDLDSD